MNEGDTVRVPGTSSYDPDGDSLSFHWTVQPGWGIVLVDSTQPEVKFKAPMVDNDTIVKIVLRVDDGILFSIPDTATVIVKNVNTVPVADAGISFSTLSGKMKELDGSGSGDPDGDSLRYTWTAPSGIQLSDVHAVSPAFHAPQVTSKQILTFKLVVSDGYLTSDTSRVEVTVLPIEATLRVAATVNNTTIPYRMRHITLYRQSQGSRWEMVTVLSYDDAGETYYAVWEGEWLITVDPVGDSAGFVTTFSGDVTQWSSAKSFHVTGGAEKQVTVRCVPVAESLTGDGRIDGTIMRDTVSAEVVRNSVSHAEESQKGDIPAKDVSIFLYRSSDDAVIGSTLTDAKGKYLFNNLPSGGYYLIIQLPGYDPNTPWEVEVTDDTTHVANVNFVINEADQHVTGVISKNKINLMLYPNPVQDKLYIQIENRDAGAVIQLYNLTGYLILTQKLENSLTLMDISRLQKGFYLLRIISQNRVVTRRIVKQ